MCRKDYGAPNVREVGGAIEQLALTTRYDAAIFQARARGAIDRVSAFEARIQTESHAVLSLDPDFLAFFLNQKNALYANYAMLVESEVRKAAALQDDRRRRTVEAAMFGSISRSISYAALALDGNGLSSYGLCSIRISEAVCIAAATLLEENSYSFAVRHANDLVRGIMPPGYRAKWNDRHKLAVVKLANNISAGTGDNQFPRLLLEDDGDRTRDRFLEVHIYGPLDEQAFLEFATPDPDAYSPGQTDLCRIRDWATAHNRPWRKR